MGDRHGKNPHIRENRRQRIRRCASHDSAQYVQRLGVLVDRRLTEMALSTRLNSNQVAVLTAVKIADDMLKAQDEVTRLRRELGRQSAPELARRAERADTRCARKITIDGGIRFMRERNLRVLEFPKIREMLKTYAQTESGKAFLDALAPSGEYDTVAAYQEQTEEANTIISMTGGNPVQYFADVRPQLKIAAAGAARYPCARCSTWRTRCAPRAPRAQRW